MAKSSYLIRQLLQSRTGQTRAAEAARGRLKSAEATARDTKKQDCPRLTSLVLILMLVMLAGIFFVQSLV